MTASTATNPFAAKSAQPVEAPTTPEPVSNAPQFPSTPIPGGTPEQNGMTANTPVIHVGQAQPVEPQAQAPLPMPGASGLGGLPVPGSQAQPQAGGLPIPQAGGYNPYGANEGSGAMSDDMVIDLSNISSGSVDFIGAGTHLVYCSSVVDDVSQAGNPMLTFTFTVASGEYTGKSRKMYCTFGETALWKLDETLRALGIVNNDSRKPTKGQIKSEALRRVAIGEFVATTYNGRATTDFARVSPPDSLGIHTGTTLDQLLTGR